MLGNFTRVMQAAARQSKGIEWKARLPDFFEASVPDWLSKSASRGSLVPDPYEFTFIAFLLSNFFGKMKFFNFFLKNIIFKKNFFRLCFRRKFGKPKVPDLAKNLIKSARKMAFVPVFSFDASSFKKYQKSARF